MDIRKVESPGNQKAYRVKLHVGRTPEHGLSALFSAIRDGKAVYFLVPGYISSAQRCYYTNKDTRLLNELEKYGMAYLKDGDIIAPLLDYKLYDLDFVRPTALVRELDILLGEKLNSDWIANNYFTFIAYIKKRPEWTS